MENNPDIEKLMEQAKLISQLMKQNSAQPANAGDTSKDASDGNYAGAFAASGADPDQPDNANIYKALQMMQLIQAMQQQNNSAESAGARSADTADETETPPDKAVQSEAAQGGHPAETASTETASSSGDASGFSHAEYDSYGSAQNDDLARQFDEQFNTPAIKAIKAAIPYVDPSYHRSLCLWVKFMEIHNILEVCGKNAASGYTRSGDWRKGMLLSMRPHVSQEKQCTIDLLIKMMELKEIMTMREVLANGG
jgi:hypothetical protein